jgi:hypothetical protein
VNTNHAKQVAVGATLIAAVSGGIAVAATPSGSTPGTARTTTSVRTSRHSTPNECIRINGGDYNACNVGNSGRGDLPYKPVK